MIGRIVSHYQILEKLGEGGMGVVYRARDKKLDRFVALKFLPPHIAASAQDKDRFIQEAKATSALQHHNICVVHDIDETDDGQIFICMEYIEGETLEKRIKQGPLNIDEAIEIGGQIAQGLLEAHKHGVVHRDIKPANILLTKQGVAKIVDFGLAKLKGRTMLTTAGSRLGTAAYMSPEQTSGDTVDEKTDIWSLGATLYEMITGRIPFKGDYDNAVIYSILNTQPEPTTSIRTGVPPEVERVIQKCLSKSPAERYQHMDDLLVDLRASLTPALQTGGQTRRPSVPIRKSRKLLRYSAVAGVAALALITYFLVSHEERSASRLTRIAVLPFENLGPAEDEYFADGLTDEITSRLGSINGLGVISRTSSRQYKKTGKSVPVIAKELRVDYILEGTIRWVKTGGSQRIRITPQLIRVSGDVELWADNIDRTLEDIFAVQTEIATRVVKSLDIVLSENEKHAIGAIPSKNLEAYQAYLRGLSFSNRLERPNLDLAIEMFDRAVEQDSTFALAYAELSIAHINYFWLGYDHTQGRVSKSRESLDRADALQSELPEANLARGYYYFLGYRDYDRALEAFGAAEKKLPSNSRALEAVAYIWRRQGKFEAAIESLKQAFELDPQNAGLPLEIGNTLRMTGEYADADAYLDRSITLLPDQSTPYLWKASIELAWRGNTKKSRSELERVPAEYAYWADLTRLDIYDRNYQSALDRLAHAPTGVYEDNMSFTPVSLLKGMVYRYMNNVVRSHASFDSARAILESELKKSPDDHRLHKSLGIVYAGLGRTAEAVREASVAVEQLPVSLDAWVGVLQIISQAQVYTMVGDYDTAVAKLEYIMSLHASREITPPVLRLDPVYDPLRNSPRFQALLTRNNK